jgi:O-antigen/teichoic acid export membrane protein
MYRRIARNSAVLAMGTAASALLTMLAVAIAARALSPHEFGTLVLLQSSALMLSALTSFSTQQPVIKLGSEAHAQSDKERLGDILSMGFAVDVAASIIAFAIAALVIGFFKAAVDLSDQNTGAAWIFAVSLLFTGYPTANGIFRLYDRFGLLSLIQGLAAAGLVAVVAVLFTTGAPFDDFVWAWAVYLASNSMLQLGAALSLVRAARVPLRLNPRSFLGADGRSLLHYCLSTWGTSTADTVRSNGDSLLIGAIVSVEAAGVYNVARQLAGILRKFNVIYTATIFPEIARLAARGANARARRLRARLLLASSLIGIAGTLAALTVGRMIIHITFGGGFDDAYWPFVLLTAAAAAQLAGQISSMYVQVYVGPTRLVRVHIAAAGVFLVAAVPLTFLSTIPGMAAAQLLFGLALVLFCEHALCDVSPCRDARAVDR